MRKIVVGFSKSKKAFPIGSWAIKAYQNTEFSHTYIRLLTAGRFPSDKILHASEGFVHNMSGTVFDRRHEVVAEYVLDVTNEQYSRAIHQMHEWSGERYGLMQNLGIVLVHFCRKLGGNCKNPFPAGWNCSEFVTEILQEIRPELVAHLDPNIVTPKEVYHVLEASYERRANR